ncbi:Oidioi.mRNA.OKI2018_I69.XSR.g14200.t1.cds [Oikopleura dioica]|uniref:Oidioi.mRNA.OKI2018_I69.XSR.g14200.t1.cds n=1 Tax=Oikopleura dioica TaxID=34765 RepID=A0ABN7SDZ1_OIKDI|nr:Oidioi.mRNA.OKI2018_I69.XSR.g14200.t1.cds [Oikopleura dioica]
MDLEYNKRFKVDEKMLLMIASTIGLILCLLFLVLVYITVCHPNFTLVQFSHPFASPRNNIVNGMANPNGRAPAVQFQNGVSRKSLVKQQSTLKRSDTESENPVFPI